VHKKRENRDSRKEVCKTDQLVDKQQNIGETAVWLKKNNLQINSRIYEKQQNSKRRIISR
jgi:hypothetical protein